MSILLVFFFKFVNNGEEEANEKKNFT